MLSGPSVYDNGEGDRGIVDGDVVVTYPGAQAQR